MIKRVLAIHDLSCVGRCSLTVALPVISSMKLETSVIPTSVLSTHTGGFTGFTYRDLTNDIKPIVEHIRSLNTNVDCIYTGYLGKSQIGVVEEAIDMLSCDNTLVVVDPVMADDGKLYTGFDLEYVSLMKKYIKVANIIIPNITEACLITGEIYEKNYDKEYIIRIIKKLSEITKAKIVLTGVTFDKELIGAAVFENNEIKFCYDEKLPDMYHGTGDLFASVVVGALMNDKTLLDSAKIACEFVKDSINETRKEDKERRYGVCFEPILYKLASKI